VADRLADGRLGVIGKAHHAMADGLAAVELGMLLLDPTPDPPPPEPDGWRPDDRPTDLELLADGAVGRAGEALALAGAPLRLLRHPEPFVGGVRQPLGVAQQPE